MFHRLTLTCECVAALCHSYPVCKTGVFDWRLVTVHLTGRQLLPWGPALLRFADLRALTLDKETDHAYTSVIVTPCEA